MDGMSEYIESLKNDLRECFLALKEANRQIEELTYDKWLVKKKLEEELRKYKKTDNFQVGFSNDEFYLKCEELAQESRNIITAERDELIDSINKKYSHKSILFVIPLGITNGGGNVVINEAVALRKMGINAQILNIESQRESYNENYAVYGVPTIFVDDYENAINICKEFDVVCGTSWQTIFAANLLEVSKITSTAYYIQDYEPYFYNDQNSDEYQWATLSYTVIPQMKCVTKTYWNKEEVLKKTGRECNCLGPSYNVDLFSLKEGRRADAIVITAMVRPHSVVRAPELTMRVLSRLYWKYGRNISIRIFGNDEKGYANFFSENETNFEFINYQLTTSEETASILADTDIFVDFSSYQAMGLTGLEAMASGCAVVLPINGGAPTYAVNEVNSLVINTLDEDICFEAVEKLLKDNKLRESITLQAIRDAHQYYPEKSAALLTAFLFDEGK